MNILITLFPLDKNIATEKIKDFEDRYQFILSDGLKRIIQNYNICKPVKSLFKKDNIDFKLNYFFGISENPYESLAENYETYRNRMPEELFPVASVDGGDLLCMNKKTAEVYYWFHETDDWGGRGVNKWPEKVSENVEEFLNRLHAPEFPSAQKIETAKRDSKVQITEISVKLKNEQRAKQGLPPLSFKESDELLNKKN